MTRIAFKAALVAAVSVMSFAAVNADATVYLRVIENNVTVYDQSSATGALSYTGASASFVVSNATVTGSPIIAQPGLVSTSMQITPLSAQNSTLRIIFSQDGLTTTTGGFTTTSTFNGLLGSGTGTANVYVGANAFDQTTLIGSMSSNVLGAQSQTTSAATPATFSETVQYDFSFTGSGNVVNANTQIVAAAVPEAATWAMMLVGFGGIGAALRSGRRQRGLIAA